MSGGAGRGVLLACGAAALGDGGGAEDGGAFLGLPGAGGLLGEVLAGGGEAGVVAGHRFEEALDDLCGLGVLARRHGIDAYLGVALP